MSGFYNTNTPGFVFINTSQGGATITNFLNCPSNVINGIYGGINPDLIIYHAKDAYETGGAGPPLLTAYTNLYNTLQYNFRSNTVWAFCGTPDVNNTPGDYVPQNNTERAFCTSFNLIYLDTYLPDPYYTANWSVDGTHPNTWGAHLIAAGIESQLGFLNTVSAYAMANTYAGLTNTVNGVVISWASPSAGFVLQQNSNLATTNWTNFGGTVHSNNTTMSVTNSPLTGNLFFRLLHP
jgi:hypothetical protein